MADGIKNSVETENKWGFCSWITSWSAVTEDLTADSRWNMYNVRHNVVVKLLNFIGCEQKTRVTV